MSFLNKRDASDKILNIGSLCLERYEENVKGKSPNQCNNEQLQQLQLEMKNNADVHSIIMKDNISIKVWAGSSWKWSAAQLVRRIPYELTKPFSDTSNPTKAYCKAKGFTSYKDCAIALLPSAHYMIRKNTEHYFK